MTPENLLVLVGVVVSVVSIILTLCIAYTRQASQKNEKLAEAVLLQNIKIADLEKKLAVAEFQINEHRKNKAT